MNPLDQAAALLSEPAPDVDATPARVETLNLCSFDLCAFIADVKDEATNHEETATVTASAESNDAKRKARRAELLRANDEYNTVRGEIAAADSYRVRLDERAARLRREFRLALTRMERSAATL